MKTDIIQIFNLISTLDSHQIIMLSNVSIIITIATVLWLKRDKHIWYPHATTILTSTGIACTFLAIMTGFGDFDVMDISKSISEITAMVKLGFIPSFLAVSLAVVFKWRYVTIKNKMDSSSSAFGELVTQLKLNNTTFETFVEYLLIQNPQIKKIMDQKKISYDENSISSTVSGASIVISGKNNIIVSLLYKPESWSKVILLMKVSTPDSFILIKRFAEEHNILLVDDHIIADQIYQSATVGKFINDELNPAVIALINGNKQLDANKELTNDNE